VKLPNADALACGDNVLRMTGSFKPEGKGEYPSTAITTVKRDCQAAPTAKPQPVYSCDNLTVTKGDGRKVTAKVDYTAKDGATFKLASYDFGDGGEPLGTDKTSVDHTYAKDGTYTVSTKLTFSVDGKDQTATSPACSKQVSFTAATTPPAAPTTPAGKSGMPNTGPGQVASVFVVASVVGYFACRVYLTRRIS
jgi:hypothetical protein